MENLFMNIFKDKFFCVVVIVFLDKFVEVELVNIYMEVYYFYLLFQVMEILVQFFGDYQEQYVLV